VHPCSWMAGRSTPSTRTTVCLACFGASSCFVLRCASRCDSGELARSTNVLHVLRCASRSVLRCALVLGARGTRSTVSGHFILLSFISNLRRFIFHARSFWCCGAVSKRRPQRKVKQRRELHQGPSPTIRFGWTTSFSSITAIIMVGSVRTGRQFRPVDVRVFLRS
jgi:hypothetical protein